MYSNTDDDDTARIEIQEGREARYSEHGWYSKSIERGVA
jgi:hypothetical protein